MKFSFINPSPNIELPVSEMKKAIGSWPPLGILYVAGILEREGIEVSVLEQAAKCLSVEATVDWVMKENPDVLGFSTLSSSGRAAAIVAREVKKRNPNIRIVFGNYHATFNAERILQTYPWIDYAVRGEGEYACLDLVNCLSGKNSFENVQGLTFRKNDAIVSTPDGPLVKDLDALPFPNRDLLDVEYHSNVAGANVAPKKFTTVLSSRGCVYRCRFCGCRKFARSRWRPRSVKNFVDELSLLASDGYKQFLFVDDSFATNPKRVIEICHEIRREKLDIEWICEMRVDHTSYDLLRSIVKAGCIMVYYGIESANQRILDYFNKQATPAQAEKAVSTARKAGVDVIIGSFIVGAPTETVAEIGNTLVFAQHLSLDVPQFNVLGVFPGTDLWDEQLEKGVLDTDKYWETGVAVSEFSSETVPLQTIQQMIHEYSRAFFYRSGFIFREVMRTVKSPYRLNLVANNLQKAGEIAESLRHLT